MFGRLVINGGMATLTPGRRALGYSRHIRMRIGFPIAGSTGMAVG
jgi:hypothetical protein